MSYVVYAVIQVVEYDCSKILCVFEDKFKAKRLEIRLNDWLNKAPEYPVSTGEETDDEFNELFKERDDYQSTKPIEGIMLTDSTIITKPLKVI